MPKISKEKFDKLGQHEFLRTTFAGDIELMLYYDVAKNCFHFDCDEMQKYFPDLDRYAIDFSKCDTKAKAVGLFKNFISDSLVGVRMLRIALGFNKTIFAKIKSHLPAHIVQMCKDNIYGEDPSGFSVSFERIMRYGEAGNYSYVTCNNKWGRNNTCYTSRDENLIEWDEETEMFLIRLQKQLDELCQNVLNFFTTDSIESLKDKMKQSPLMLEQPK